MTKQNEYGSLSAAEEEASVGCLHLSASNTIYKPLYRKEVLHQRIGKKFNAAFQKAQKQFPKKSSSASYRTTSVVRRELTSEERTGCSGGFTTYAQTSILLLRA